MYYIFDTKQKAIDYDNQVSTSEKYQKDGNWDNPRKHPTLNKWAIAAHSKYPIEGKEPQVLNSDWFNDTYK